MNLHISSRFSPTIFLSRCKFSTPTNTSTPLYSSRFYAQNPVFKIVRDESVKCLDVGACLNVNTRAIGRSALHKKVNSISLLLTSEEIGLL